MTEFTRGNPSIGLTNFAQATTALPSYAENPEAIIQFLLGQVGALRTLVEGKADARRLKTLIRYSDETILLQANDIALVGRVTFMDVWRDQTGQVTGGLHPSLTRIRGGVIQTEQIISSNWGASAGSAIDLDNGEMYFGGWSSPKFRYQGGNLYLTGTLQATSIIAGSVTLNTGGGESLTSIQNNAQTGYNINQALTVSGTTILKGVLVPTDSGALKVGTITWDSSTGALTGGTGVALTEWGIIGASGGVVTFTINAVTGAAVFAGSLSAATGTFAGSLSAATGTFAGSLSAATGTFAGDVTTSGKMQATGGFSFDSVSAAIHGVPSGGGVIGVYGNATSGGVLGKSSAGAGVEGQANGGTSAIGVKGQGNNNGDASIGGQFINVGGVALDISGVAQFGGSKLTKTRVNGQLLRVYDTTSHAQVGVYEYSFE
jgi:hypothetical protein